jgi:beta-mannosidase
LLCRYNDRNYKWVADETWSYQAEFSVSPEILGRSRVDLVLEGVDTVAEVYVNDWLVGKLNNAHRYSLDDDDHELYIVWEARGDS